MERIEIYDRVNKAETIEELVQIIKEIGDQNNGRIQGRSKSFDAYRMAEMCQLAYEGQSTYNTVTREFGLRQQLLYLTYYSK